MFGFLVYGNMKHEIFNRMNIRTNRSFGNIHPRTFLSAPVIHNPLLDELLYALLRHRLSRNRISKSNENDIISVIIYLQHSHVLERVKEKNLVFLQLDFPIKLTEFSTIADRILKKLLLANYLVKLSDR